MSELTLTLVRLGLLALLWVFVFGVITVLRTDLYGTRISRRVVTNVKRAKPAQRQPAEPPTPQPRAAAKEQRGGPRPPTTVVVTEGQLRGTSLPLGTRGILIGRSPECTLVLDDEFSSGRHARIFPRPEGWFVEDLGSRNGTFVGGARITGTVPVTIGTTLRVGRTTVELRG